MLLKIGMPLCFRLFWSDEDQEWVCECPFFSSGPWLDEDMITCFETMKRLALIYLNEDLLENNSVEF